MDGVNERRRGEDKAQRERENYVDYSRKNGEGDDKGLIVILYVVAGTAQRSTAQHSTMSGLRMDRNNCLNHCANTNANFI